MWQLRWTALKCCRSYTSTQPICSRFAGESAASGAVSGVAEHATVSTALNTTLIVDKHCSDGCRDEFLETQIDRKRKLEIRSVEHGICPIAEFTSPLLSGAAILAIRP